MGQNMNVNYNWSSPLRHMEKCGKVSLYWIAAFIGIYIIMKSNI